MQLWSLITQQHSFNSLLVVFRKISPFFHFFWCAPLNRYVMIISLPYCDSKTYALFKCISNMWLGHIFKMACGVSILNRSIFESSFVHQTGELWLSEESLLRRNVFIGQWVDEYRSFRMKSKYNCVTIDSKMRKPIQFRI